MSSLDFKTKPSNALGHFSFLLSAEIRQSGVFDKVVVTQGRKRMDNKQPHDLKAEKDTVRKGREMGFSRWCY